MIEGGRATRGPAPGSHRTAARTPRGRRPSGPCRRSSGCRRRRRPGRRRCRAPGTRGRARASRSSRRSRVAVDHEPPADLAGQPGLRAAEHGPPRAGVDAIGPDDQVVGRRRPVIEGDTNGVGAVVDRGDGHAEADRYAGRTVRQDSMQLLAVERDRRRHVPPQSGFIEVDEPPTSIVEEPPPFDHRAALGDGVGQPEPSERRHAVAGQVDAGPAISVAARSTISHSSPPAGRPEPWPARRSRHRRSGSASPSMLQARAADPITRVAHQGGQRAILRSLCAAGGQCPTVGGWMGRPTEDEPP